jgi:endonuclease/exonuclease/phosphatase family metal-dependent hydrolase
MLNNYTSISDYIKKNVSDGIFKSLRIYHDNIITIPQYTHQLMRLHPQKFDDMVGPNRLLIGNYKHENTKLMRLKNNHNILRLMTFNLYECDTIKSECHNLCNIIRDISPDILCVQEYTSLYCYPLEILLRETYTVTQCMADIGNHGAFLKNKIYIKKHINIMNIYTENETRNIRSNGDNRCANIISIMINNKKYIIANVHLHNMNDDTRINNLKKLFQLLNPIIQNVSNVEPQDYEPKIIIMGDLNSYNLHYMTQKQKDDFRTQKLNYLISNNYNHQEYEQLFNACIELEQNSYVDIFNIDPRYHDNRPMNTTRYGGRVDHMYVKNITLDDLIGLYTYYSKCSDHLPIICDLITTNMKSTTLLPSPL